MALVPGRTHRCDQSKQDGGLQDCTFFSPRRLLPERNGACQNCKQENALLTRNPRRIASACAQELAEFLHDQRLPASRAATLHELSDTIAEEFSVDAGEFARVTTMARYGPLAEAADAARRARIELRELKRKLWRGLFVLDRARGLVSVRSLGLG